MHDREYAMIGSIGMDRPGFVLGYDLTPLLRRGPWRGENLLVESKPGRVPKGRVLDQWQVLIQFNLFGERDRYGNPHADERDGVAKNLQTLIDQHWTGQPVTLWHVLGDRTRSAEVIVEDIAAQALDADHLGRVLRVIYDLTIPAGKLIEIVGAYGGSYDGGVGYGAAA